MISGLVSCVVQARDGSLRLQAGSRGREGNAISFGRCQEQYSSKYVENTRHSFGHSRYFPQNIIYFLGELGKFYSLMQKTFRMLGDSAPKPVNYRLRRGHILAILPQTLS